MNVDETAEQEELDRHLSELLGETRVMLATASVLFAFLLTLPFTTRFDSLIAPRRAAYFLAFASTAFAMVFLIGGSAYHRLRGKPYDKARMLITANRQAITALVLLGTAMTAAVFLISDLMFPAAFSVPVSASLFALIAVVWFAMPLIRKARNDR